MDRLRKEKERREAQLEALRHQQELENPVLAKAKRSTEEVDSVLAMLEKEIKMKEDPAAEAAKLAVKVRRERERCRQVGSLTTGRVGRRAAHPAPCRWFLVSCLYRNQWWALPPCARPNAF